MQSAVVLPRHDHTVAPSHGFAVRDSLDDSQCLIPEEVLVDTLPPVDGYGGGRVASPWSGRWVEVNFNGRASHARQRKVRTSIECR
jgi:hypothetical protein